MALEKVPEKGNRPRREALRLGSVEGQHGLEGVLARRRRLAVGSTLGVRSASDDSWAICLVRWARSDNPEHVELGLEVLAPSAQAVHLAANAPGAEARPALLLPALPRLERGETLLALQGSHGQGGFTLIAEEDGRVRVAQCQPLDMKLRTNSFELFAFGRNEMPH